ncbi:hypothetical protein OG871_36425 [Kitasatospora sp. NBC_00374]|uniref:hypothetical protein n=1 Tax=Kitasatospora sp. NBC_00374 TaxID=2975964 RepID=UPI0030E14FA6
MHISEEVYEARYGWSRRAVTTVVYGLLFTVALALIDPGAPASLGGVPLPFPMLVVQLVGLPLFGLGGLLTAYNASTRKVTLRVDAAGVLLGGHPLRYAATTAFVPWSEISGVELWIHRSKAGVRTVTVPYVGIHRLPGSPRLPRHSLVPRRRAAADTDASATTEPSVALTAMAAELRSASRTVNGGPLDTERLLAAVRRHAPWVTIVVDPEFAAKR